jgi:GNAT superfamily N-acetyltransferase
MSGEYVLRAATPADVPVLMHHMVAMFADMGAGTEESRRRAAVIRAPWTAERMARGEYFSWLFEHEGEVVAGADVWLKPRQPGPSNPQETVPYVLNVYCDPVHRRRGLARRLLETMVAWSRERGYLAVELHASDEGRPLYADMGFVATNEMRLAL